MPNQFCYQKPTHVKFMMDWHGNPELLAPTNCMKEITMLPIWMPGDTCTCCTCFHSIVTVSYGVLCQPGSISSSNKIGKQDKCNALLLLMMLQWGTFNVWSSREQGAGVLYTKAWLLGGITKYKRSKERFLGLTNWFWTILVAMQNAVLTQGSCW